MRPDPGVDPIDVAAWLSSWRARMWAWWRLQVVAEAGVWATAAAVVVLVLTRHSLAVVAAGLAVGLWRSVGSGLVLDVRSMLQAIEAARPELHNALVTWHEAQGGGLAMVPAFEQRLGRQAHVALRDAPRPVARRPRDWWIALAAVAFALGGAWLVPASQRPTGPQLATGSVASDQMQSAAKSVSAAFRVSPPAYTGRPPVDLGDATLVEALTGSTIEASFGGLPLGASVRLSVDPLALTPAAARYRATFTATRSGLLTMQDAAGRVLRTIAIQVTQDAAPHVRLTTPGLDLRVADAARVVPLAVTASDDIGLRSLRLLYTRVTGGGESFDFIHGELPLQVRRASPVSWQGSANLDLAALGMAQGDTLVYHAAARDGRLDADGLAESERYLIQIPKPGDLAGGDFSLPEPEQRYALSQRMVIQLTERLLQRRARMPPTEYLREAQGLAVQQRRVRTEFVFLMGGDVIDEVEEAEHSHEIEAGRLDNSGQRELLQAVRQMSQAEQRLTDGDLGEALPYEYRALNALQAAFGKARYFMRTLPTTVAIDVTRRGRGDLDLAAPSSWQRAPLDPSGVGRARDALTRLASLTPAADLTAVSTLADTLVSIDAETTAWLQAVQGLVDTFARSPSVLDRQRVLDAVTDALRARLLAVSPAVVSLPLPRGRYEAELAATPGGRR